MNATVTGNQALGGADGVNLDLEPHVRSPTGSGSGFGGGLFNHNGTVTVVDGTLAGNTADNGGTLYNLGDGASASASVNNSILADAVGGTTALLNEGINGGTTCPVGHVEPGHEPGRLGWARGRLEG